MQVAKFTEEWLMDVAAEIRENGTAFPPMIHFLPGRCALAVRQDSCGAVCWLAHGVLIGQIL